MGGRSSKRFSQAVGLKVGDRLERGSYGGGYTYKRTYNGRPVAVKKIHDILVESTRSPLDKDGGRSGYDTHQGEWSIQTWDGIQ